MSNEIFFALSGEHPTLPPAEIRAIFEARGLPGETRELAPRLVVARGGWREAKEVGERSGMCKLSGIKIFECALGLEEILRGLSRANLEAYLKFGDTFAVRAVKLTEEKVRVEGSRLERAIGGKIARKVAGLKVDLESPRKTVLGILLKDRFILGLEAYRRPRGALALREPRRRPALHPATMRPKLARCMVNLARPVEGGLLLDPFCGVGGLLIEAGLVGCKVVGCDVKLSMVKGAIKNLIHFGIEPEGLVQADARRIPFNSAQSIATDPPYGTAATTLKSPVEGLLEAFFPEALRVLESRGCACLAAPKWARAWEIGEEHGFKLVEKHEVYVHRRLTREIIVLRKK
ncbi:TPA: hypothetical protein EYP26_00445 [Candidatus Bathyarchaeota archaeon]|nr:hypothetical protein [Candidatus Bathyarchaeota archaeon]